MSAQVENRPIHSGSVLVVVVVVALLAGCVSAKSRFESARSYEAAGRWAAAADAYLDALGRDRDYPGAREGAQRSGDKAIEAGLAAVESLQRSGDHVGAADRFAKLDSLRRRAVRVDVMLKLPADFQARRRTLYDRAIDDAIVRCGEVDGDWNRGIQLLDRVQRYDPRGDRLNRLHSARFGLLLRWGEALYGEGRYKAAHDKAQDALRLYPENDSRGRPARVLMESAIDKGTLRVGVVPLWRDGGLRDRLPEGFLAAFNELVEDEYLSAPPPAFVALIDSRAIRRRLRGLEFDRDALTTARAAEVGQLVGADLMVVPLLTRLEYYDAGTRSNRTVPTRDGGQATYVVIEGARHLAATIRYAVIDVGRRQVLGRSPVELDLQRPSRHAVYGGDVGNLVLSRAEQAYFDRSGLLELDRELERELMRELAKAYLAAAYEDVLKGVE